MTKHDQAFASCINGKLCDSRHSSTSGSPDSLRNLQLSIGKTFFSSYSCCFMLLLVATSFPPISAQGNFTVPNTFDCSLKGNMICLGGAHIYTGNYPSASSNGVHIGSLSFIPDTSDRQVASEISGIAYYNESIRLLDPSTNQSASFKTSFTINVVEGTQGDGMAFVISADSTALGLFGPNFGIFDSNCTTYFKSIVVEFDGFSNPGPPYVDINGNHVSFDFGNISSVATHDLSDVVFLGSNVTIYAWVEYSNERQQLELRVNTENSRPISPLLSVLVDLFDVVEEYMWVGFSAGSNSSFSHYYVGHWNFESYYEIPLKSSSIAPTSGGNSSDEDLAQARARPGVDLVVGTSVGVFALLLGCILVLIFWRRSHRRYGYMCCQLGWSAELIEDPMVQLEGMPERFSYKQLTVATREFHNDSKLGQGGFGSVYRGVLPSSGLPVAVKKINVDSTQGEQEFMTEVSIINQLRHRNLIQLKGWCINSAIEAKYLLVYELMPNGSLDKALFRSTETETLSWSQRLNIVKRTAAALDYLHQGWKQQVLHRDVKSSNIMLDDEWNPKLGDFGLARLVAHEKAATTTLAVGTYGYIAPEVACSGKFTDKSDVYAFGAVVLEVACGRKALMTNVSSEDMLLVDWVWRSLSEGNLLSTVDKRLGEFDRNWMEVLLKVGLLCSHPNSLARPSMRHVIQILAGDAPLPPVPVSKPGLEFTSDRYDGFADEAWSRLREEATSRRSFASMSLVASIEKGAHSNNSDSNSSYKIPVTEAID